MNILVWWSGCLVSLRMGSCLYRGCDILATAAAAAAVGLRVGVCGADNAYG